MNIKSFQGSGSAAEMNEHEPPTFLERRTSMRNNLASAAMTVASLMGVIALALFVRYVMHLGEQTGDSIANVFGVTREEEQSDPEVSQEVIAIYVTQAVLNLAKTNDLGALETQEKLASMFDQAAIKDHWLVSVNRVHFQSGAIEHRPVIARPGKYAHQAMNDRFLLRLLAGKTPPEFPAPPEITVFPDHLLKKLAALNPDEVWKQLKAELGE
ncbi:MAG: hypothetical protein ABS79_07015 [Planctomycetes bacterium SCN 63-9]|nr:MAG: hypothetical protein ABS79_07015 [Planctomycetes bacterium SCN 63-9]